MATKRQAPSDGEVHQPSKRSKPSTYQHQQRPAHHGKKSFKKAHPVNELKSTVRNLRRLLDRNDDLPANVRVEKERALQTAERDLREAERAKKRSDMIGKWHKIRFFERQKAERRLKKAKRTVKEAQAKDGVESEELSTLNGKLEDAEVDLNYTMYFPLEKDYVSLWPAKRSKDDEGENDGEDVERHGNSDILGVVRKCMKEGTLKDLREGRLTDAGDRIQEEAQKSAARPAKRKNVAKAGGSKHAQGEGEEDESGEDETGGGFFE